MRALSASEGARASGGRNAFLREDFTAFDEQRGEALF
jgi:hypothetical protein